MIIQRDDCSVVSPSSTSDDTMEDESIDGAMYTGSKTRNVPELILCITSTGIHVVDIEEYCKSERTSVGTTVLTGIEAIEVTGVWTTVVTGG